MHILGKQALWWGPHTQQGYCTPVKPHYNLTFEWPPHVRSAVVFCSTSPLGCVSAEGCEVGQWSEWGACTRRNKTCGYKWGLETRTRHIVKKPPKDTIPCPTIAESRMCKMAMRHCRRGKDVMQPTCAPSKSLSLTSDPRPRSRCPGLFNIKENSPLIPQGCSFLPSEFHLFHVTPRTSRSALFLQRLYSGGARRCCRA